MWPPILQRQTIDSNPGLSFCTLHGSWKKIFCPGKSWWWRELSKVCCEGEDVGWFQEALVWKIGSRDKNRFWEDTWVGRSKLITLFLRLYSLSMDQLIVGQVEEDEKKQSGIGG